MSAAIVRRAAGKELRINHVLIHLSKFCHDSVDSCRMLV